MDGQADEPVSVARRIRDMAKERGEQEAFRQLGTDGPDVALTWTELDERSDRLAGAFAGRGVRFGDRIGIGLRNGAEFVLASFAAWKLGAVPVPSRWDLPEWELQRLREVIDAPLHLSEADLGWIGPAALGGPVPDLDPDAVSPRMHGICSSGSTGTPKVIVTNRPGTFDTRMSALLADSWAPVPRPQVIMVLAPMYHANGFTTLYHLLAGDRLVTLQKFDAARVVDAVERHGVTTFTATPTMLQRIADLPGVDDRDLGSLHWILQGAAPMPPSLVHRWAGLIGAEKLYMAYGMTEALGLTALRGDEWMDHPGSVGRGVRGTELRIVGDDGAELPAGEIGGIYMRSPFYGGSTYLGDAPELPTTEDGFRTAGDLGHVDADGFLHLADRRVDLIITGGANVFPAEVEAALIDHPKIADVVVIGLRDPEWGRRVHAILEAIDPADPPTTAEVVAYAKERLAAYKVPKTVELVDAIPRSEATKINRGALVRERDGG